MSASFTSNESYLIAASNDCNVYIWNCNRHEEPSVFESNSNDLNQLHSIASNRLSFSLANDFYIESNSRGSATWPEEKLRASNQRSLLCKSEYRFLKTSCQNLSRSRAWGLVIVTASRDGRIQSFHNYDLPVPV
ncbi:hypothetical protein LIER_12360 [Lithospermum erythrorhizon]|uniref:Uncharacterized protein n=1 Tax=Lithospermum erythrorhizon TaxID=34254 RepID=A0AAV3PRG6_LITER